MLFITLLVRIKELCIKNSTTLATLEKTLGFGNGTLSRWDMSSPSVNKILKVANYFNVSVDYLIGNEVFQYKEPQRASISTQTPFFDKIEALAELLGYKISINGDMAVIEFNGKKTHIETASVLNLMDTVLSYMKFTLQEAVKNASNKEAEDSQAVKVAARGGIYELDKKAAESFAESASKAPNRSQDRNLF